MYHENNMWSSSVQGCESLYKTRALRFSSEVLDRIGRLTGLGDARDILEAGCGPGALLHKLARRYPRARVTGIDMDSTFVRYASEKSKKAGVSCNILEGDVLNMPFDDDSFDAVISHTLVEHVPLDEFLLEQYRICRPGGSVTTLHVCSDSNILSGPAFPMDNEEKGLWDLMEKAWQAETGGAFDRRGRGIDLKEIPVAMEKNGYTAVVADFIAVSSVPDSAHDALSRRLDMISAEKQVLLDAMAKMRRVRCESWDKQISASLRKKVDERFEKMREAVAKEQHQWDMKVVILMIVSGFKPLEF